MDGWMDVWMCARKQECVQEARAGMEQPRENNIYRKSVRRHKLLTSGSRCPRNTCSDVTDCSGDAVFTPTLDVQTSIS